MFRGGDFGNPTRTEGTYGRILCIGELKRGHNKQWINCSNEWILSYFINLVRDVIFFVIYFFSLEEGVTGHSSCIRPRNEIGFFTSRQNSKYAKKAQKITILGLLVFRRRVTPVGYSGTPQQRAGNLSTSQNGRHFSLGCSVRVKTG